MRVRVTQLMIPLSLAYVLAVAATFAEAAEPLSLHERVDRLMERRDPGPGYAPASDAEFLRRASIDLVGMPPSIEDLRAFLADSAPDKREKAVDRLMASPLFERRLVDVLNVMLMERRPNTHIAEDEWVDYLLAAVRANKPVNQLFREILAADGSDAKLRPAARFYLDRAAEPNLITRDVGRIFFGRDMQCAQCHDHPLIEDYRQTDYHGLLAILGPGHALTIKEGGKDKVVYAERAGGNLTFDSVFVKNDKHVTGPRLPGSPEIVEKPLAPGDEYEVKPADGIRPVPRISRRLELASLATDGSNRAFNENVANRLWALMMGRGLVHPPDLHHPVNPPADPELMRLLGEEIAKAKFDVRTFLRELALTKVYQQAFDPRPEQPITAQQAVEAVAAAKKILEVKKTESEAAAKIYSESVKAWYAAETAMIPALTEEDQAKAKHDEVLKKRTPVEKALNDAKADAAAKREIAKALAEAGAKAVEASKKLPAEADLAAAARKFVDRSTAIGNEAAAVEKTFAEKIAALKKVDDEAAIVARTVETARAKVKPLRDGVRAKEAASVVARLRKSETRMAFEQANKRLATLEAYANVKTLEDRKVAAERSVAARRDGLASAQKQSTEFEATLMQKRNGVAAAQASGTQAEAAKNRAQAVLDERTRLYESVLAARSAVETAGKQDPSDETLTEVSQKLAAKAETLKVSLAVPTRTRDSAATEAAKAASAIETAKKSLAEAVAEKERRDKLTSEAFAALNGELERVKTLQSEIASERAQLEQIWTDAFSLVQLKPLTPEQMCWSIMKVGGVYDRYREAEEAELNKTKPLSDTDRKDLARVKDREREIEKRTHDKLKGNVGAFISIYGAGAGQPQNDFFATVDQALFASNGGSVNAWVGPSGKNVASRMIQEKDPKKAAEDLYLTVLSRSPTGDEVGEVVRLLTEQAKDKPAAVQELVWGLVMSAEFRFNH